VYNHLNLPQTITVRTTGGAVKGTITYTYDAAGNKLKKEVNETGQPLKTTLYIGGAVPIAIGMKTMCCSL
jgi:YD repeat-containing protein